MKALILAAGLGTRLLPLTLHKPKALVEVCGKTLLERTIEKLAAEGWNELIINIHHHAGEVRTYLASHDWPGVKITLSDESSELLDTGGALKKASYFFDSEPFLVFNTDVATRLNTRLILEAHRENGALATLAVSRRVTQRYLLFDAQCRLTGRMRDDSGVVPLPENNWKALAFSGIHVISPEIFRYFPAEDRFSMIEWYIGLCNEHLIRGYDHTGQFWADLGKPESIARFEAEGFPES